jgi:hypothetical protein
MSDDDLKRSILPLSSEKSAARTTGAVRMGRAGGVSTVGGQPQGNQRELPPIPSGIEQLLAMAAVDERFARALQEDRASAVDASGVDLGSTEAGILSAIDDATLERMVAGIGATMPEQDRRAFLGRSAAALVALVGAGSSASCQCPATVVKGVRPDRPPEPGAAPPEPKDPEEPASQPTNTNTETKAEPASAPTRPIGGLTIQDTKPQRGVRPDRPRPSRPMPTKGIRPKRPLVGPKRPKDPLDP